jgi:TonB family protein
MRRKQAIFPIALACSLCLHAVGMEVYVRYGSFLIQPLSRPAAARPVEMVVQVDPDMLDFGEAGGTAIGSNRSEGEHPLEARQADQDQALLSREPVGSGRQASEAVGAMGPSGGGMPTVLSAPGASVPVEKPQTATPPAPATPPVAVPKVAVVEPSPQVRVTPDETDVKPQVVETPPNAPSPPSDRKPQRVQVAVAMPNPSQAPQPGVPSSAGLPLPPSDSDSDPFSRVSSTVVFRNGRLEVQRGRKFKTVRPQIGIAGELDALGMSSALVVLEVHIDPTGKVTQVELFRRSGSVAIDERTRDAVYHWTAEPARDKAGRPMRDVVYIAIEYR